ncbi:hypothetical protein [Chryseobacterium sp. POL2]|uniref:hypothetical protein n=1 Tax=Chryseobacterium sp. POL2 TaxID=2713414 RepID=UPI0016267115|nr:hypothetical protein [Chryseobacterium sp. POL2]
MISNQIGSYGMLFSFLYGGYYWLSIVFSAIALFTGFAYCLFVWKDTKTIKDPAIIWLKYAAFFAVFSAIGIFGLAYFSSQKEAFEEIYRASGYFYLHYQYNGFFLFSCIGIVWISLRKYGFTISKRDNKITFILLFLGTFLGYGLSVLWMKSAQNWFLPMGIVGIIQLFGAVKIHKIVVQQWKNISATMKTESKLLLKIVGITFLLKFVLQGLSAIPEIGVLAFNNINIVIAYLHLVLLVGVSLFLIWKIGEFQENKDRKFFKFGLYILVFGVISNEIILILSSLFSVIYIPFSFAKYGLLLVSGFISMGILMILFNSKVENLE